MTRMLPLLAACALSCANSALAAPPPDHPSPAKTMELLLPKQPPTLAELPNEGKVVSATDANEFTYIEVDRAGAIEWLAAPQMAVKPGSTIRYEEGSPMSNFYSKLLQRTFPKVIFVGHVVVTGQ